MEVDYILRGNICPGGFAVQTPMVLVNLHCNVSYKLGKPRVLKSQDIFVIFYRNVWKQWMYLLWLNEWMTDWQHLSNKDSFKSCHYPGPPLAPRGIVILSAICLSGCLSFLKNVTALSLQRFQVLAWNLWWCISLYNKAILDQFLCVPQSFEVWIRSEGQSRLSNACVQVFAWNLVGDAR